MSQVLTVTNYKGYYATVAALTTAIPTGAEGWWAIVEDGSVIYIWNVADEEWATGSGSSSSVTLNPALSADLTVSGLLVTLTAGENLVFGEVVYIKSDGKMGKADANAASTFPCLYMAAATIANNAAGTFLKLGFARNDAWNWTVGGKIYLSTTAGGLTQTAPSATDECNQSVATALTADIIDFGPSPDYITLT